MLQEYMMFSYDILVNFIEGHDKAVKMFAAIKQNQQLMTTITMESFKN